MRQASLPRLPRNNTYSGLPYSGGLSFRWSGRQDSNLRGLGSKPSGLTATPHPEKKKPQPLAPQHSGGGFLRLPREDSNLCLVVNSHRSYLWTTRHQTES